MRFLLAAVSVVMFASVEGSNDYPSYNSPIAVRSNVSSSRKTDKKSSKGSRPFYFRLGMGARGVSALSAGAGVRLGSKAHCADLSLNAELDGFFLGDVETSNRLIATTYSFGCNYLFYPNSGARNAVYFGGGGSVAWSRLHIFDTLFNDTFDLNFVTISGDIVLGCEFKKPGNITPFMELKLTHPFWGDRVLGGGAILSVGLRL